MTLTARKPLADLQLTEDGRPTLRRALGPLHLTTLGIGSVIGTGIFVLTGTAASQHAGPALVLSMIIAAVGCALAGLCYAELAAMIPVAGSAYTYAYASSGQLVAWIIGWDLILEYALERGHRRRRLVRLLRELPPRPRPVAAARAHRRARIDRGGGRRLAGARGVQPARGGHRRAGGGAAGDRHQAVGRRQHGAGGDQGRWCSCSSWASARRTSAERT